MSAFTPEALPSADEARGALVALRREVAKAVVGQDETVTAMVVALLSTLYPSWRAAAVQPAEALRYE